MEKVRRIARTIYGAEQVDFSVTAGKQLDQAEALGLGSLPICMAKTHLSLSDDERRVGRPRSFDMTVREVRFAAGAGFLVPLTGEIMTMPGLPRRPHAVDIDLRSDGTIVGVQ
jgi:formate--tetrahydrofolate ligase